MMLFSVMAGSLAGAFSRARKISGSKTVTNACCFLILRVVILLAVADNQPKQ
jgi:hypothetical protein